MSTKIITVAFFVWSALLSLAIWLLLPATVAALVTLMLAVLFLAVYGLIRIAGKDDRRAGRQ
jgi:hypothetical protein